jgi:hypothetical protein
MRKSRILWLIAIAICLLSFSACSSLPSEANGRERLEREGAKTDGWHSFSVESFQKTNGQEGEVFGVKVYKMEFVAKIKCERDGPQCQKGQVSTVTGSVTFEKTEQGWIAKKLEMR